MRLDKFNNSTFFRGAPLFKELLWIIFQGLFFSTWLPGSWWRVHLLRFFGASVGIGVIIKSNVRVKFPWKLIVQNNSWIGESVWIDNLDFVTLNANSCVSQGAYLCTGSHNWSSESFDLSTAPIVIGQSAWVGAFSRIGPGVVVGDGTVCALGSVITKPTGEWEVVKGNPASVVKLRPKC